MLCCFRSRQQLILENLCLRQQLTVALRGQKRPKLNNKNRRFWILIHRLLPQWQDILLIVKPDTILKWHRRGWKTYWRFICCRKRSGRKPIPLQLRQLIRQMAKDNPLCGQIRILGELLKLGFKVPPRGVRVA